MKDIEQAFDVKGILAVGVGLAATIASVFLVVFGAITGNGGYVTAGIGVLSAGAGSIITYFFSQRQGQSKKRQ